MTPIDHSSPGSHEPDSYVLHGGSYKLVGRTLPIVLSLILLVPTLQREPVLDHVVSATLLAATLCFDVRWFRARVVVDPTGLQLRGPFRTHNLTWDQVLVARAVASNGNGLAALVQLQTTDRRRIKVDGVGQWGAPKEAGPVGQTVRLINRYSRGGPAPKGAMAGFSDPE